MQYKEHAGGIGEARPVAHLKGCAFGNVEGGRHLGIGQCLGGLGQVRGKRGLPYLPSQAFEISKARQVLTNAHVIAAKCASPDCASPHLELAEQRTL